MDMRAWGSDRLVCVDSKYESSEGCDEIDSLLLGAGLKKSTSEPREAPVFLGDRSLVLQLVGPALVWLNLLLTPWSSLKVDRARHYSCIAVYSISRPMNSPVLHLRRQQ